MNHAELIVLGGALRVLDGSRRVLLTAALLVCSLASSAAAQVSPASQEEPLEPDRPDVTNGTHIVDVGLVQLEIGGLYTHAGLAQHAFGSPVTARVGLTDWFEARIGTDGYLKNVDHGASAAGVGNVQVGAKLRLWAEPGGVPVLSILPTINLPEASAAKGLGSGDADYTLALLTGTDVGDRTHVDLNYGIGSIGAGDRRPHFVQHLASVSASYALTAQWNPYAEAFWFSRLDPIGGAETAVDIGAIYTVTPRFALDGGVQAGLTRAAPAFSAFGGVSVVLGNVLGQHGVHARQRKAQARMARPPRRG